MPAKSVAELSQTSRSTTNENRSVTAKVYNEIDKTKLSPKIREKLEKYQRNMQNASKVISKLFLDNETKDQIDEAYFISYQTGENLILQGSKNLTEDKTSDFLNKWTEMLDILENYFDFNPNERYTQFIDETTKKIIDIATPLGKYVFDDKNMSEKRKLKITERLKSYQDQFNESIAILSKQTYKYFKGELSASTFTQTVKGLISNVTSFDNLFFHQTREDAKNILYQVHAHLNRILDAIYDYHANEQSITECDSQLSKITRRLKSLFNIRNSDELYSDSEYDYDYYYEDENNRNRKPSSESINNETNAKKKEKPKNIKNVPETEEQLKMEISELKKSLKIINKKNLRMKNSDQTDNTDPKTKFTDLSFMNDYLNQIILLKKEFNEEMEKDLKLINEFNQELEENTSNPRQNEQKANSSSRKIKREIANLNEDLKSFTEELEKYRQLTAKPLQIRPKKSNIVEIKRAIIELKEQEKGIQSSIEDMKDQEKKLIEDVEEIGTVDDPVDQIIFDMINFSDSRKREIREIENQLKNSEPIQKAKKIPKELEAYRNDKFASNINDEYLNTKKKLEEARNEFDSSLTSLNDSIESLLNSLAQENESTIELYQIEINDKKSLKYIISRETICKIIKEKELRHTLKNKIDTVDKWLTEKFPQYNKFDISAEEKLILLKKAADDHIQRNQD